MKLVIKNFKKNFEKKEVLKDINFEFEKGKIYGLLGRNGAGKTTLFNCLNEDLEIDAGEFYIQEENKRKIEAEDIGYVLSVPTVPEFLTAREFLKFFIDINNGGLFGSGIGNSKQKYSYIPEPHTDMVFSIIAEEQGFLFGSIILMLMFYVVYRVLKISANASTIRGKYICLGVASYIFMHMFVNLGGLFALIPLTGVPLPFLSYGGSFTLSLIISLAIVQRVNIETRREKIEIK